MEHKGTKMVYDRILTIPMPFNYGTYLKGAIQEDGDALDVVILGKELEVEEILDSKDLEPLAVIEYYDSEQKDVKVIFGPKKQNYSKQELSNYLYQISVYINYLYYYKNSHKVKPNYVTAVYYGEVFGQNNLKFLNKIENITYLEKSLKPMIKSLLDQILRNYSIIRLFQIKELSKREGGEDTN